MWVVLSVPGLPGGEGDALEDGEDHLLHEALVVLLGPAAAAAQRRRPAHTQGLAVGHLDRRGLVRYYWPQCQCNVIRSMKTVKVTNIVRHKNIFLFYAHCSV